ncbi:MAG: TonB-dependent receptor [Candidatus Azobacteroides sp.]|nr:TonB-dependent receptor [Candidatus Azobacteroides sp.]
MKKAYILLSSLFFAGSLFHPVSGTPGTKESFEIINGDTIYQRYSINEVSVVSFKEQTPLEKIPASVSVLKAEEINSLEIISPNELTSIIPNLYMPDYGSKITSSLFIRGIGSRMNEPAVGLYVDNVPYLEKSAFDFNYYDLASIEVLRGPQGALYGRNAMGGIINVSTISPLKYQGTHILTSYGNENTFRSHLNHYWKVRENLGMSIGLNYTRTDGFFTNEYNGEKTDNMESFGRRFRLDWEISNKWFLNYTLDYEYSDQGGYPYRLFDKENKEVAPINYNDETGYRRKLFTNGLVLNYKGKNVDMNATTSYQYFDDRMLLDQDFQPANIFTLQQDQKYHAVTEEVIFKAKGNKNYQWLFGAFGFYQKLRTNVPVNFKDEGIRDVINPNLASIEGMPFPIEVTSDNILNDGTYKTPRYSGVLFHQSTINRLFTDGLSLTLGVRLDYEKVKLDYFSTTSDIETVVKTPMASVPFSLIGDTLSGKESMHFTEFLPKVSLKYMFNDMHLVYASVGKGYKAGGYNLQIFSDIMQERIKPSGMPTAGEQYERNPSGEQINDLIMYKPEYSWNYEIGARSSFLNKKLFADASLFYIDCKDMQLVQSAGVMGRTMKNAGQVESYGAEVSLTGFINDLRISFNYGFTHATFKEYTDSIKGSYNDADGKEIKETLQIDYKNNYSPMAPKHTLSLAADYTFHFSGSAIDKLILGAQYAGAGRIYWTAANDAYQDFYGLLNLKVSVVKGICQLDIWTKNTLDKEYRTFYYESMGNSFVQSGRPFQIGANVLLKF